MFDLLMFLPSEANTEHGLSCGLVASASKINNNARFKQEHVESFPLTTENIIYPPLQYLSPPNLAGL